MSYCVVQCWFRIWRVWGRHRKRQIGQLGRCGLCSPVEPRQSCQSPAWKDKMRPSLKRRDAGLAHHSYISWEYNLENGAKNIINDNKYLCRDSSDSCMCFLFKLMISRNILVGLVFRGGTGRFVLEMLNSENSSTSLRYQRLWQLAKKMA